MEYGFLSRAKRVIVAIVLCVGSLASTASASQFSADMFEKSGLPGFASHIYVKNGLIRREIRSPNGFEAVIYRLDKSLMWILQVPDKTYVQADLEKPAPWMSADYYESVKNDASKKLLGTETINGYDCDKYLITFKNTKRGKITQWVAEKLNYPIKVRAWNPRGDFTIVCKNIVEKKLPDRLFELPADFSKLQ